MHEQSAVNLSLSESLESSVSKELSDSVPLGSIMAVWSWPTKLPEHLSDMSFQRLTGVVKYGFLSAHSFKNA